MTEKSKLVHGLVEAFKELKTTPDSPLAKYLCSVYDIHQIDSESPEAENIRCESDKFWLRLEKEEKEIVGWFSEALHWHKEMKNDRKRI